MKAVKIGGKVFVLIIEYVFLVICFIPYLFLCLLFYFIQWSIDYERYEKDEAIVRNGTAKERREVQKTKNAMYRERQKTFTDRMFDYWKEHLFSKKSSTKKSRK